MCKAELCGGPGPQRFDGWPCWSQRGSGNDFRFVISNLSIKQLEKTCFCRGRVVYCFVCKWADACAMEKLLWPGIEIREIRARPFHERGPDWESLYDCSFPSRASEISEFVGDVLIWWLPAADEDNPLLLNDALIVAEMENASNDQECGVLVVLQSLGTRTNVCVQREGNNDLPVEATVSWSVEATVSWWVSRNTAPSFRCWCGNAQSWAPKVCLQAAGIKTGNQTENPYKSRLSCALEGIAADVLCSCFRWSGYEYIICIDMLDISASCYAPKFSNRFVSWSLYLHPHDCWRCEWIFLLWISKPMHHSFVCGAISFEKVAVYTAALSRPCKSSQFVWILLHPSTSSRCHDGTTLYDMSSLSSGNFLQRSTFPLGHDLFIWCPKLWRLWAWAWRHFHVGLGV